MTPVTSTRTQNGKRLRAWPVYMEVGDPGNPLRWGNPPVRNIMTLILI